MNDRVPQSFVTASTKCSLPRVKTMRNRDSEMVTSLQAYVKYVLPRI